MRRTFVRREPVRSAYTLVEVVLTLAIVLLVAGIAAPRLALRLDQVAVAEATAELAGAFQSARDQAIAGGRPVTVRLDEAAPAVTVQRGTDTLLHRDLAAAHRVRLDASRDSMAYLPTGLAAGAANLGIEVTRGAAAHGLAVSRLGRVRW